MASSAEMISSFEAVFLLKLRRRLKALLGGLKAKTNAFGPARFGLRGFLADLFARGAALAGDLLDQRQSSSADRPGGRPAAAPTCCRCPASRQTFRTSGGMALSDRVSVIDVRDLPSRLARSSCV